VTWRCGIRRFTSKRSTVIIFHIHQWINSGTWTWTSRCVLVRLLVGWFHAAPVRCNISIIQRMHRKSCVGQPGAIESIPRPTPPRLLYICTTTAVQRSWLLAGESVRLGVVNYLRSLFRATNLILEVHGATGHVRYNVEPVTTIWRVLLNQIIGLYTLPWHFLSPYSPITYILSSSNVRIWQWHGITVIRRLLLHMPVQTERPTYRRRHGIISS